MTLAKRFELYAGIGLVLINRLALRFRLLRRADGWRRATGLMLRQEAASFVLSAFGLRVPPDEACPETEDASGLAVRLARRLHEFLERSPEARVCVRRGEEEDWPDYCHGPSYSLRFEPWVAGPERFVRPDTWVNEDTVYCSDDPRADVLLNFVCRVDPGGRADLWVRVNHIGADGVPVQELLSRLETEWGPAEPVAYPTPESFDPCAVPRVCNGRSDLVEIQTFMDFSPLLAWRNRANVGASNPLTVSAALGWCLARHPRLAGLRMGTTVEMPADSDVARGVGVVVLRPSDYFHRPGGLLRYARDFNRQMAQTRSRASLRCRTLSALAMIPARMAKAVMCYGLARNDRQFGSLGLTMVKDARVFGAPLPDMGHENGFLAVGSLSLPTSNGVRVGCVTIKGPRSRVADYPNILRSAIGDLAGLPGAG